MNNLQIVEDYQALIWSQKDISAIDQFFDKNALIHSPVESIQGTQQMKAVISQWLRGFPNLKVYWDDFICEKDKVVSQYHAEGIHEGEFLGKPPTNNKVQYSGATIYQLIDEKIHQYWAYVDLKSIKKQISEE